MYISRLNEWKPVLYFLNKQTRIVSRISVGYWLNLRVKGFYTVECVRKKRAGFYETILEFVKRHILRLSLDLSFDNHKVCHFYFKILSKVMKVLGQLHVLQYVHIKKNILGYCKSRFKRSI